MFVLVASHVKFFVAEKATAVMNAVFHEAINKKTPSSKGKSGEGHPVQCHEPMCIMDLFIRLAGLEREF